MRKPPTIVDVAKKSGVSVSVVSRVLNEGTGPVAFDTREKVLRVIEDLGYQPRAAARELQNGTSKTIGLVLADLTNPFFARLADRVVWNARSKGYNVILFTTQEDPHLEAESIETLISKSVGAVIATPTGDNVAGWKKLLKRGVSVIFVDREIADLPEIDVVSISNEESASVATKHLIELGHSRIAIISGPTTTSTGKARMSGYLKALAAAKIKPQNELMHSIPFRGDSGSDAVGAILNLDPKPSAIIIANTAQVQSAMRRIQQSGIKMPSQLSVVVFDDSPWTDLVSPPLSIIKQPIEMLAVHSVDLAIARIKGSIPKSRQRIEVSSELIKRSSSTNLKQK